MEILAELRQKLDIVAFEPILKGWSSDKKYRVKRLLRRLAQHDVAIVFREEFFTVA